MPKNCVFLDEKSSDLYLVYPLNLVYLVYLEIKDVYQVYLVYAVYAVYRIEEKNQFPALVQAIPRKDREMRKLQRANGYIVNIVLVLK